MPINIPDNLPARMTLENEGVLVMRSSDAARQDIRPLEIALLNLMPTKIQTETQILRLIGATPLQVNLTLVTTASYQPKNTRREHMLDFYNDWDSIRTRKFDGLIITGAPIEQREFENVDYWHELQNILDWTQTNIFQTFNICWGAQAALYHFHQVNKRPLPQKACGIYCHKVLVHTSSLLRGFNDSFAIPVSRYTEICEEQIPDDKQLIKLADSDEVGLCLLQDLRYRQTYMFNHLEYDAKTLNQEYQRDLKHDAKTRMPHNYFPDDKPQNQPINVWRSHAHLLIGNWINDVYQATPYDVNLIGC